MKFEGLTPTRYTITHVLQALHDATPPQVSMSCRPLLFFLCQLDLKKDAQAGGRGGGGCKRAITLVLFCFWQAERAEHLLLHLCYDDYGNIKLTPHMVNLVIDAWVRKYLTLESKKNSNTYSAS
jgi:hypothetical protein